MVRLLSALSLAMVACAAPLDPGSLRVNPEPALAPEVTSAAERIERATGIAVHVGEGDADLSVPARLVPRAELLPDSALAANPDLTWSGFFDGKRIRINAEAPTETRAQSVLHEVLHAVMLSDEHLPGDGLVMSPIAGPCLTAADLEFVCAAAPCTAFVPECEPSY